MIAEKNPWRPDFPVLNEKVYHKPLIYLDNAATSQVPLTVIERMTAHYMKEHANVHRGLHRLSEQSTMAVEEARESIRAFIGAGDCAEIIFTQGTTDSVHLVAEGIRHRLHPGCGIMTTVLEHHSDFIPWQQVCMATGADFYVCPAVDGELDLETMTRILKKNHIVLVAAGQISNLTGTVSPLEKITALAHQYGAEMFVDGAQGILHKGIDVTAADVDYYAFSGHKMLGPTGTGVLYGKKECLEELHPVRSGGGMAAYVSAEKTVWEPLPHRLEAGTLNISGIIGLGEAVRYLQTHHIGEMRAQEAKLLAYAQSRLEKTENLHILGHPEKRLGVISFVVDDAHPYDIASMLDKSGIAVRSGSHCAQLALRSLGVNSAVRISPAFYNTEQEIDVFCETLDRVIWILRKWKRN